MCNGGRVPLAEAFDESLVVPLKREPMDCRVLVTPLGHRNLMALRQ
jgi:hypothetical protein